MKSTLCIVFIALTFSVAAQPAFTSNGEIKISEAPASGTARIAANVDGALLVLWGNASQWLDPFLGFNGSNSTIVAGGFCPVALPNNRWGVVQQGWKHHWGRDLDTTYHFYSILENAAIVARTSPFWVLRKWSLPDDRGYWEALYSTAVLGVVGNEVKLHDVNESYDWDGDGDFWSNVVQSTLSSLKMEKNENIHSNPTYMLWGARDSDHLQFAYGLPFEVYSPLRDGIIASYLRYGTLPEGLLDLARFNVYSQALRIFDAKDLSLKKEIPLDSVSNKTVDLSHKLTLGANNTAFLASRRMHSDSIGVVKISLTDGSVSDWNFIFDKVKTYSGSPGGIIHLTRPDPDCYNAAEYLLASLPDGRLIVVWTRMHSACASDIYTALFDENMQMTGLAKRVNSDTTGNQHAPAIAMKGDTINICWLDERTGQTHVYLRRFTPDQITAVDASSHSPDGFAIEDVSPNPVNGQAVIRYRINPGRTTAGADLRNQTAGISLIMYDMLGRIALTIKADSSPGVHVTTFDASGISTGIYRIVMSDLDGTESRKLVVLR